MIECRCHCGAVHLAVPAAPREVTSCNCSICRRYGTLWAYYPAVDLAVTVAPDGLDRYRWGDRTIDFNRCRVCGCVTHWSSVDPTGDRAGVNARLFDPAVLAILPVRRLDGAETWAYLDPPTLAEP